MREQPISSNGTDEPNGVDPWGRTFCAPAKENAIPVGKREEARKMLRSGIWIVWGLGILGVLLFGGLQKLIEFWWLFFATGLLAGASMVVVRSLERLKDMDTRLQIQADQLQQLQAQLDRLTQAPSSEESDEPG